MTNTGISRSWAIVGVVGKSNTEDTKLLEDARSVGEAIARRGHAVLTGGHHRWRESSVKYRALSGAVKVANELECVRLIGVVPRTISARLTPPFEKVTIETHGDATQKLRYAYVHTQLKNQDRDAITGHIADVLIALPGKSGTPREVAAALIAERPVVFFKSLSTLQDRVTGELEKQPTGTQFPRQPLEAASAWEALDKALSAIGYGTSTQRLRGCHPDMKAAFDDALSKM